MRRFQPPTPTVLPATVLSTAAPCLLKALQILQITKAGGCVVGSVAAHLPIRCAAHAGLVRGPGGKPGPFSSINVMSSP